MSNQRSGIYNTMRGGQIVFHYVRMTIQVVSKNSKIFVLAVGLCSLLLVAFLANSSTLNYGSKYMFAYVKTNFLFGGDDKTTLTAPSGKVIQTTWKRIYENEKMEDHFNDLKQSFMYALYGSLALSFFAVIAWFRYLGRRGSKEAEDDYVRGAKLGTIAEHKEHIKNQEKKVGEKSQLSVAGVALPPKSHRTGIALIGSPGVGKSASILDILAQQRAKGDKNFILDPGGEFTRKFYREGVDIILSPRDERSVYWDVWSEGESPESYHITASSLIAESGSEKGGKDFFAMAARFVFEAVCERLGSQSRVSSEPPSLKKLTNFILRSDDETLVNIVKHSDAKSVLNDKSEKTAASIRATLSTFLQPLAKLPTTGRRFSFNEWIGRDDDSWVFVPLLPKHRAYYRPVLTMWMEHFTIAVLSRPTNEDDTRTYNLFCDELTSYNKIPSLLMFLAESRKYSGNAVLGFQNRSQLEMIYGDKGAHAIEGLIGTFGIFRVSSTNDSRWASELLLSSEVEKSSESLSIGSHDIRDSVSVSKSTKDHRLVTASEIVNLDDLDFYFRFGKGFNVLKVTQTYPSIEDIAAPLKVVTDESIAHKAMLDHRESIQNEEKQKEEERKNKSEDKQRETPSKATNQPSDQSPPDGFMDNDYDPAEYDDFASKINLDRLHDRSDFDGNTKSDSGAISDKFTRGF